MSDCDNFIDAIFGRARMMGSYSHHDSRISVCVDKELDIDFLFNKQGELIDIRKFNGIYIKIEDLIDA